MSDESYIGVDPEYQNHAYDTDAPLSSEDPAVADREQVAVEYIAEAAVQPPPPEHPFEPAAPAEELEVEAPVEPEAATEEAPVKPEAAAEEAPAIIEVPEDDGSADPEEQTPEGV